MKIRAKNLRQPEQPLSFLYQLERFAFLMLRLSNMRSFSPLILFTSCGSIQFGSVKKELAAVECRSNTGTSW